MAGFICAIWSLSGVEVTSVLSFKPGLSQSDLLLRGIFFGLKGCTFGIGLGSRGLDHHFFAIPVELHIDLGTRSPHIYFLKDIVCVLHGEFNAIDSFDHIAGLHSLLRPETVADNLVVKEDPTYRITIDDKGASVLDIVGFHLARIRTPVPFLRRTHRNR